MKLRCCKEYANEQFNPRLFVFHGLCPPSVELISSSVVNNLSLLTVTHLGHHIHYDLSDVQDINHKLRDMVLRRPIVYQPPFPHVGP